MDITPKFQFVEGSFDTKTSKMVCVASEQHGNVSLFIKSEHGWHIAICQIHLPDFDLYSDFYVTFSDAKALCEEAARRWNEFPEDLKR